MLASMSPPPDVVVVGSANVDLTVRVAALPGPGETVLGRSLLRDAGGKGLNQAVAAARAGAAVAFVGAVGDDGEADLLRRTLDLDGIVHRDLRTAPGPTGTAMIAVGDDGENQIVVAPGANLMVDAEAVDDVAGILRAATVTLTQLEIAPSALGALRRHCRLLVLNPAPARTLTASELAVDVLVPNARELAALAGTPEPVTVDDAVAAARRLSGPAAVVVTLGALGAVVVAPEGDEWVPAPGGVTVVDTTAAGDTLCGYLAAALADGADLVSATRLGVQAASLTVTRPGATRAIPTRAELTAGT
jgi:ribokinase